MRLILMIICDIDVNNISKIILTSRINKQIRFNDRETEFF